MCLCSNGGAYSLIGACVKKCDTAVPLSYLHELFWSGHGRGICYLLGVAIHPWDINIYHPCQISCQIPTLQMDRWTERQGQKHNLLGGGN